MQPYCNVPKVVRLNSTHFFIIKISNERELEQTALNHSSDIGFRDLIKIYKKCTAESYSFLVNDATHASDKPLRLRKKCFKNKYIIKSCQFMIRLEMKNYNKILTEKLLKYLFCYQTNLIIMNILHAKKYYHLIKIK